MRRRCLACTSSMSSMQSNLQGGMLSLVNAWICFRSDLAYRRAFEQVEPAVPLRTVQQLLEYVMDGEEFPMLGIHLLRNLALSPKNRAMLSES